MPDNKYNNRLSVSNIQRTVYFIATILTFNLSGAVAQQRQVNHCTQTMPDWMLAQQMNDIHNIISYSPRTLDRTGLQTLQGQINSIQQTLIDRQQGNQTTSTTLKTTKITLEGQAAINAKLQQDHLGLKRTCTDIDPRITQLREQMLALQLQTITGMLKNNQIFQEINDEILNWYDNQITLCNQLKTLAGLLTKQIDVIEKLLNAQQRPV